MTGTRDGAIQRSLQFFDNGGFRDRLAELVAIRSTSQEPEHAPDCARYVEHVARWLKGMGFAVQVHANPAGRGLGPILTAERLEPDARQTVLTYGYVVTN